MNAAGRSDRALFLAAVAVLGLVVTPLVHAEQHHTEEHDDQAKALAEAWRASSSDPLEALAFGLEHAHESQRPNPQGRPEHDHPDGHSHGPDGSGPHGSGPLAHLGIALHAAPQLPDVDAMAPEHAAPAGITAQLCGTLRYLVPEWSQGPPVDC
jgi:hypothetical protein